MSKPRTKKQIARHNRERGPRPKEVMQGAADPKGVAAGVIYFHASK